MLAHIKVSKRLQAMLLVLVMIASLLTGSVSPARAQSGAPNLFVDAADAGAAQTAPNPAFVSRSRFVSINNSLLINAAGNSQDTSALPEIAFNLFPDTSFIGLVTNVESDPTNTTWSGTLKNEAEGYFYLVATEGVFIIHIASLSGIYEVSSAGNGLYKIIQIDQSKLVDDYPHEYAESGPVLTPANLGPNADSAAIIDVMVVYTQDARAAEGSTAAMKARIALAVTETNKAYSKSGVTPRLRLVHTEEISYPETGNIAVDLERLANTVDGYMDNVHSLRNIYGADMVSLVVENGGGYCGIADAILANEASAFLVTARDGCLTGYYSLGHEFGHLQGARHDVYVDPVNKPFAYGHGYTFLTDKWRTIMAYDNKCQDHGFSCTRLQYFANPNKSYGGHPLGVAHINQVNKVINNTAFTVANFRTTRIGANFSSNFNHNATGWSAVNGSWVLSGSKYYVTIGEKGIFSSAKYAGTYGDLSYQVKLKRDGNSPNYIIIRGNPANLGGYMDWNPSYTFGYNNSGYFSVWKIGLDGRNTPLMGWTSSAAIVQNGWNTLEVVAVGSSLQYYINDVLVYTGEDSSYVVGQVGIIMFQNIDAEDKLYVDSAVLTTTATANVNPNAVVEAGVTVPGGSPRKAP